MTTKYHYHYLLFSYRQTPPPERMTIMVRELRTPVNIIRGYAQLLNKCVQEPGFVSAQACDLLQDLLDTASTLDEIVIAEIPNVRDFTEDTLQAFRALILPLTNHIAQLIDLLASMKQEIEQICSDILNWHGIFLTHYHHIWATVDVLTNSALELPPDILYWINHRQSFWQEVHQGDSRSFDHILTGLKHPEIEIRRDAIRLLGQLKHPDSYQYLLAALTDTEPEVRVETVQALKEFGDQRAISPLRGCLNDEKEYVRLRAKEAIEYLDQC